MYDTFNSEIYGTQAEVRVHPLGYGCHPYHCIVAEKKLWLLVRKQNILTEQPPLASEVSANFCG
jgi:hypothetical protein